MALNLILITIGLGAVIWYLLRRSNQKRIEGFAARNVKYVPMRNPFVSVFKKERLELTKDEIIKREGKIWGFNMMNSYTILLAEPELIQLVLTKEFTNFTNRRTFKLPDPILGKILSNVQDEQWKRLRSIMTPTFSTGSLRRMKPKIDSTVQKLVDNFDQALEKSPEVDMKQLFGAFTMETIIHVAFGVKVDTLQEPNNPIIVNAKKAFSTDMNLKAFGVIALVIFAPKVAEVFDIRYKREITDFFAGFAEEIIKRKKEEIAQNPDSIGKASSFLELILEAEAEGEKTGEFHTEDSANKSLKYMTSEEMVAQCILFFLAGYETTATTITMASYLLALNPEVQEKLYQEVTSVVDKLAAESPDKDPLELVTMETLGQFKYLAAVIDETLRIYPPAAVTERQAGRDIVLQSEDGRLRMDLKKDDVIHIPIYSVHRDVSQFPNPEKFQPERFIGDVAFHKYAFLPFGAGPRNCIAKSLALIEAKFALLHTVRNFKLSKCNQTKIPVELVYNGNFISPRDVILKVEKRNN